MEALRGQPRQVPGRFAAIDRLYGQGSVARLAASRVMVIGVGGVGSWAAEGLVRSGLGKIALVDADTICASNINRQAHALSSTLGASKVVAMAARLRDIHPQAVIEPLECFATPSSLAELLAPRPDLVLDCCDAFRLKVELAAFCRRAKLPLIVSGSAGGRTDPTQVRRRDLSRTEHDALLSLVRKKLRTEFGFPKNTDRYFGIGAVFSLENVRYPQADGSVSGQRPDATEAAGLDCGSGLGSAMHVTSAFAATMVAAAIDRLLVSTAPGP